MTAALTPAEWAACRLSLEVSLRAVLLASVPAIAVGWLLARRRFVGYALVDALVHLPLVLPPVVTGYLLLLALGRGSPFGRWIEASFGWHLAFSRTAAVIAAAVVAFPLFVRSVRLAIELVDPGLEDAARTLGAGPVRVFSTITLPLALPGLVTGAILAFARSLGEFGATIIFAGNIPGQTQTIPLAVFSALQVPGAEGEATSLRLVLVAIALSLGALVVSEGVARRWRRLERSAAP